MDISWKYHGSGNITGGSTPMTHVPKVRHFPAFVLQGRWLIIAQQGNLLVDHHGSCCLHAFLRLAADEVPDERLRSLVSCVEHLGEWLEHAGTCQRHQTIL